jgi:hypothetical protein
MRVSSFIGLWLSDGIAQAGHFRRTPVARQSSLGADAPRRFVEPWWEWLLASKVCVRIPIAVQER